MSESTSAEGLPAAGLNHGLLKSHQEHQQQQVLQQQEGLHSGELSVFESLSFESVQETFFPSVSLCLCWNVPVFVTPGEGREDTGPSDRSQTQFYDIEFQTVTITWIMLLVC